jgi:uroporphyrinogen-III synthase
VSAAGALGGLGVLVTRPAHQADGLCRMIEEQGGKACRFPVLEILPPSDTAQLQRCIDELDSYDWAVFVSANAVDRTLEPLLAARNWPSATRIAVIGKSSAQALLRHGLRADLCPAEKFDSEALLALPAMQQMAGLRVAIFRGEGGREYLADTLRARGAHVDYVEVYRRARPQADAGPLLARWRGGGIDIVVINSAESLHNLVAMVGPEGSELLRRSVLLVVSERMLPLLEQLGFQQAPVLAANASDTAVLKALAAWQASRVH